MISKSIVVQSLVQGGFLGMMYALLFVKEKKSMYVSLQAGKIVTLPILLLQSAGRHILFLLLFFVAIRWFGMMPLVGAIAFVIFFWGSLIMRARTLT